MPRISVSGARFGHVSIVAVDWRGLAAFYSTVFGWQLVPPERDYAGPDLDDVEAVRREVLANGGGAVGDIVTLTTAGGRRVTWCYLTDPEGNILELQSWSG
ncbi:MAG: VOC family protein [Candidatus Limnocylindria bacterium]